MRRPLQIALIALILGLGSARGSPANEDAPGEPGAVTSDPEATRSAASGNDRLDGRNEDLRPASCGGCRRALPGDITPPLRGARWCINDELTNRARAEGLLMNVRMVNAVFEDRRKPDLDPDANTGPVPGAPRPTTPRTASAPSRSAFRAACPATRGRSTRRSLPTARCARRTSPACGASSRRATGTAWLSSSAASTSGRTRCWPTRPPCAPAVVNVARWIRDRGFRNVVLEIANEFDHGGFDHRLLRTADGEVELIRLAKETAPGLLVSTSGLGPRPLSRRAGRGRRLPPDPLQRHAARRDPGPHRGAQASSGSRSSATRTPRSARPARGPRSSASRTGPRGG